MEYPMITICTVLIDEMIPCLDTFFASIRDRTDHVDEVLIAHINSNCEKEWTEGKIRFHQFPHEAKRHISHTTGLHACIDRAKNDYLLFTDPDVFYYTKIDSLYMKLLQDLNLQIVGISHHNSVNQAFSFFPIVVNMMVKKSDLPGKDWMRGLLRDRDYLHISTMRGVEEDWKPMDGHFLVPAPIPGYFDKFPNHKDMSIYDVGCNLYLWHKEKNWKWLSFQTTDCHTYTTGFCRGNVKVPKLPKQKLLYHVVGASNQRQEDIDRFNEEFRRSYD